MKRIKAFVLGIVVAVIAIAVANYRVIITSDRTIITRKSAMSFSGTFIDTRAFGPADWLANPGVVADLISHGLGELTGHQDPLPGNAKELLDRIKAQTNDAAKKALDRAEEALPKD